MKIDIFADGADIKSIKKLDKNLLIKGFTTNPTLMRQSGIKNYLEFAEIVNPDCLSLDYKIDPIWAKTKLKNFCLQGGMDPKILFQKDKIIFGETKKYLDVFKNYPYIFNLGHGLLPKTDPNKVNKLINFIKDYE